MSCRPASIDATAAAHPVGGKAPNAFGLYDLAGNLSEWVEDGHPNGLVLTPTVGSVPAHAVCYWRELRGGSWLSPPSQTRAARRDLFEAFVRLDTVGFRLMREVEE